MPALDALAVARDEQVRHLLASDENVSNGGDGSRRSRFALIADMNETLKDPRATYELFVELDSRLPAIARQVAFRALPAIVAAGDFTLAERYMADPLDLQNHAADLNRMAGEFPLFSPTLTAAPRLAAELSNFMRDVRLRAAVLHGLGRASEADALRHQALAGLASEGMRALAQRELAVPGTIIRAITDHRMELEAAPNPADPPATASPLS